MSKRLKIFIAGALLVAFIPAFLVFAAATNRDADSEKVIKSTPKSETTTGSTNSIDGVHTDSSPTPLQSTEEVDVRDPNSSPNTVAMGGEAAEEIRLNLIKNGNERKSFTLSELTKQPFTHMVIAGRAPNKKTRLDKTTNRNLGFSWKYPPKAAVYCCTPGPLMIFVSDKKVIAWLEGPGSAGYAEGIKLGRYSPDATAKFVRSGSEYPEVAMKFIK